MRYSIVSKKGQVVIPAKIRVKSGIHTGTKIQFVEEDNLIKIFLITERTIDSNRGLFKTGGKLLFSLLQEK